MTPERYIVGALILVVAVLALYALLSLIGWA